MSVRVVIFSPFSNIWDHTFPEALIAEGLVSRGATVEFVRCDGMLVSHCVAMSASGVAADAPLATRQRVCVACRKRRDLLDSAFGFPARTLDAAVETADHEIADNLRSQATTDNWTSLTLDGVPIGRYAAYEFLLDHKVLGTDIPGALWPHYLNKLEQAVLAYLAGKRILAESAPDAVIVYNRLYGVNHAFCEAAGSLGIRTYTLQGGGHVVHRGETMTMFRDTETLDEVFSTAAWKTYREQEVGAREVGIVEEHFDGLLEGSSAFAYSSAFEASQPSALRERFGCTVGKPTLLIPLSSEDELNAARLADALPAPRAGDTLFADQFTWLRHVLDIARSHPELHFVVRMHPRMFPNKRENVVSPMVAKIRELLEDAPSNMVLNVPSDGVSLYDLMQIVDVLLNFRSSAGVELAAFGIPVVIPASSDFFTYPAELNRVARSEEEYESMILEAIAENWSFEAVRATYRWFAFLFTRIAVDLSGSVHSRPSSIRPKKPGLRLWLWRKLVWVVIQYGPLVRERIALRNRSTSATTAAVFDDVITHDRGSLAESAAWPVDGEPRGETALLNSALSRFVETRWAAITDDSSLAGRVRAYLERQTEAPRAS